MTTIRPTHLATAALVVATLLLSAQSSLASKQALVNLSVKQQFFGGTTYYSWSGTGVATVNTTTTPTPKIIWPANILSGATNVIGTGPYTPFFSIMATYMNFPGAISKSHAGAAASGGSTVLPPTATTKCFASIPPFAPGPPALPGSCFPRGGSAMRTPGSKKFGGSSRLIRNGVAIATRVNFSVGGNDQTSAVIGDTRTGPMVIGNYGIIGSGTITNTVTGAPRNTFLFQTEAPFTTGTVVAGPGSYATNFSANGSHNLNTAGLTGMISLVRPFLNNKFSRDQAGNFTGKVFTVDGLEIMTVTFLPEPGVGVQLVFSVLGLGALCALRRRWR